MKKPPLSLQLTKIILMYYNDVYKRKRRNTDAETAM